MERENYNVLSRNFRGVKKKKKRQKDKEKPYAAFVAEKREMGTVLRGSNYLVAETTFAAAEAYEHLCCLQAFLLKHLP